MMASIANRKAQMQAIWRDTVWEDVAAFIGPNADMFRATRENQRALILNKGHGIAWGFSEDDSRHYSMDANNELHVQ
jgi:hypothetical protein